MLATKTLQVLNQRLSLPAAQIFTKLKNWAMPASRISSMKYLLTINGQCSTQSSKTTQAFLRRQPSRILPKCWQRNPQTFLLTCLMFIAAQQRNTNIVPELLQWEVALPPPSLTIPTTGAVKFATKASVVEGLVSFTEKRPFNNDAIFIDRGVTTVIIDASVLIRKQRPKNSHRSFEGNAMFLKDLIMDEISKFDRVDMVFD